MLRSLLAAFDPRPRHTLTAAEIAWLETAAITRQILRDRQAAHAAAIRAVAETSEARLVPADESARRAFWQAHPTRPASTTVVRFPRRSA